MKELRERVDSFPRWHYEFDLDGVRTPVWEPGLVNRHRQRKKYFFSPLVELCGGSLAGKRVLDIGCNAGFWSLSAIEAGADFVLGVDGRQMHVDQANLVFEAKGVDPTRYRFVLSDVFKLDLSQEEPFDIVLCLGLLYHVSKPFELMERISSWNRDLLVVDTSVVLLRGQYFKIASQNVDELRSAVDRDIALVPSSEAVARLVREFDYASITMLRPRFTSWERSSSYRRGGRRAFIAAKRTSLEGLDSEPIGANVPDGAAASAPRGAAPPRKRARRRRRRLRAKLAALR